MTEGRIKSWLDNIVRIWVTKKPDEVVDLVSDKFIWHDAPFDTPITTKKDLQKEWQTVFDHDNIQVSYEILTREGDVAIAHWHATFTRISSKEKVELDGIYKVVLDDEGRCVEFHQWYNSR